MSFEPKKEIRGLNLTGYCLFRREAPSRDPEYFPYVMGTREAFTALETFLKLQQEMLQLHGTASRTIYFRRPWQIEHPPYVFDQQGIEGKFARVSDGRPLYLDSLKIKADSALEKSSIVIEGSTLLLHCAGTDFGKLLATCVMRQRDQTHGTCLITVDDDSLSGLSAISCPPLGDWYGIE